MSAAVNKNIYNGTIFLHYFQTFYIFWFTPFFYSDEKGLMTSNNCWDCTSPKPNWVTHLSAVTLRWSSLAWHRVSVVSAGCSYRQAFKKHSPKFHSLICSYLVFLLIKMYFPKTEMFVALVNSHAGINCIRLGLSVVGTGYRRASRNRSPAMPGYPSCG